MDINNVGMLVNTKLTGKLPTTFGEMVDFYLKNRTADKLEAGLCVAGGGMSWGGHSILSALGGGAYAMRGSSVDTRRDPVPTAVATNISRFLLKADGTSNGFLPATETGCKNNFLAGKVPYAIIGNWEWKDYVDKGFSMDNLMPVPGVSRGTFGSAFGSVSGALLTSFAADNGNDAAAKSLLSNFFASTKGVLAYQTNEQRPPAHKAAAARSSEGQKAFGRTASRASIPQLGAILAPSGNVAYWDASSAFWEDVLVKKVAPRAATAKLNSILRKNIADGVKNL
jgi:maltose-binding protein MalE